VPSFKAGGREWLVAVDGPKIRTVRKECGVDLGARDCSQFDKLTNDPLLAQDVLWQLCRKDAEAAGLDCEQFQGLLSGDVGEAAGISLIEAVIDFFPSQQRKLLRDMLAKNQAVQEAATEAASARLNLAGTLEAMKADAIAEVNAALDRALSRKTSSSSVPS
jgi:hypothetical protein